jgi:hypothetical protein
MHATIRKLIVKPFGVIVNSGRCRHDERRDACMPNISISLRSSSTGPENRAESTLGPSPMCSTKQYTFLGNLRPVCPFEFAGEKLQIPI